MPGVRRAVTTLPPLSLYVHLPWCVRKCPYCDFNSHEAATVIPEAQYADALIADLEATLPAIWGRRVQTVFFGGGTPSLFSAATVDRLIGAFRARLPLAPDCEITLEANPGAVDSVRFGEFRSAGINRLSVGVQSFNPRYLQALGRIHDDAQARDAVALAKRHFDEVNLDVMYALPGQSIEDALSDVEEAIRWNTTHLSFYHLTIEPGTVFERRPPVIPDADASAAIEDAVHARLAAVGYQQYETSAFARLGHECRHNMNYWRFGDYAGIGAGAHGKLSFPDRVVRQVRARQPREYMKEAIAGCPVREESELRSADLVFEFMMNALRLREGFEVALFEERTGLPIVAAERGLKAAESKGLLVRDARRISATETGRRFLNDLLQLFLPR
jgi:oxygen-independent coproporphyrinogen-3 oxidase